MREFAGKHDIENYFDVGRMGVEHAILPEQRLVGRRLRHRRRQPYQYLRGAGAFSTGVGSTDLATAMATGKAWFKVPSAIKAELTGRLPKYVTGKDVILHLIGMIGVDGALYKSLEFAGDGVASLSMDDRLCIANMAIEAGAKNGIFPVDSVTLEYVSGRFRREVRVFEADSDAEYERVITIELSSSPDGRVPHLPENTRTIDECGGQVKIDQVVIGSCTNGRLEDMRAAAEI